ncbi:MAG: hypothetical protein AAGL68_03040 [Pseudomonadota bacterium]
MRYFIPFLTLLAIYSPVQAKELCGNTRFIGQTYDIALSLKQVDDAKPQLTRFELSQDDTANKLAIGFSYSAPTAGELRLKEITLVSFANGVFSRHAPRQKVELVFGNPSSVQSIRREVIFSFNHKLDSLEQIAALSSHEATARKIIVTRLGTGDRRLASSVFRLPALGDATSLFEKAYAKAEASIGPCRAPPAMPKF